MTPQSLKKLLNSNQSEFAIHTESIPYVAKGITDFEGLCLWSLMQFFRPQIMIESGVSRARSTQIICEAAKYLSLETVYAFDKSSDHEIEVRQKLSQYNHVKYAIGNSDLLVQNISLSLQNKKVGVFIDGPKGEDPYASLISKVAALPGLEFVASHDCYPGGPNRIAVEKAYRKHFHKNYDLFFTDASFDTGKKINASLRNKVMITHPDKIGFLDENCYYMGIITRRI